MKPNSCLYRAVNRLCQYQFGISIPSDTFDKYNQGDGIEAIRAASVINEALSTWGIHVEAIFANLEDRDMLDHPELLHPPKFVANPAIAFWHDHAEALIGKEYVDNAIMAITLTR